MKRRRSDDLGVSAFNCKNADRSTLRTWLEERQAAGDIAAALIEVWRVHHYIAEIAEDMGWRVLAEKPGNRGANPVPEHGDTVLLLAPLFELSKWEIVALTKRWYVETAKRWHEPRRLIRAVGAVDGQRVELLAVHGPTNNRWNQEAVAEFQAKVEEIVTKTHDDTTSVVFGDGNLRVPVIRRWARKFGAKVRGWGPDWVLVLGGRVRSRRRGKRGSDHYAMAHRIRPGRHRPGR